MSILLNKPLFYGKSNTSKIKDLCDDLGWGNQLKLGSLIKYKFDTTSLNNDNHSFLFKKINADYEIFSDSLYNIIRTLKI